MTDPKPVKPPGDVAHLNRLLQRWADEGAQDEEGRSANPTSHGRLRRLVGVLVIAGALDGLKDTDGDERIAFKGGSGLSLRFGLRARASQDLDAAYRGDLDEALGLIAAALGSGWHGFTGVLDDEEEITRPGILPPPRRLKIKLRYKGKPFVTIPFEVSAAEGSSLEEPEVLPSAVSLAPIQLDGPEVIPFLPIRYQIAQKLHACTEDYGEEQPNQRAHDLADLLLIEELAIEDGHLDGIREACVEIFAGRAKHDWPPVITIWPDWPQIWAALSEEEGLELTLEEAAGAVRSLVARIDAAEK